MTTQLKSPVSGPHCRGASRAPTFVQQDPHLPEDTVLTSASVSLPASRPIQAEVADAGDVLLDALQELGSRADLLPCRVEDADLWFADTPGELDRAKQLCHGCPVRALCLDAALARREPWGVWGGSIFEHGVVIARKRPRGRPRKSSGDVAA